MRSRFFHVTVPVTMIAVVMVGFAGCWKKSGEAVVLEKEHIAAAEPSPTPKDNPPPAPSASPAKAPEKEEVAAALELAADEIVVDSIVMKKDVRGTSRDPRAIDREQWIVRLEMIQDLRKLTVFTERARWEKLKVGDRVKVTYRQGKYTGSIWSVNID